MMFNDHLRKPMTRGKWALGLFGATLTLGTVAAMIVVGMRRGDPTAEIAFMSGMVSFVGVWWGTFAEVAHYVCEDD